MRNMPEFYARLRFYDADAVCPLVASKAEDVERVAQEADVLNFFSVLAGGLVALRGRYIPQPNRFIATARGQ